MSRKIEELKDEFSRQADHPQGGDLYIGVFNRAMAAELSNKDSPVVRLFEGTICQRGELTAQHSVILAHRAFQHSILVRPEGSTYPEGYMDENKWKGVFNTTMENDGATLKRALQKYEVTTTKYSRYAGLKFVMGMIGQEKKLDVLDLGCGGDHGLPGIKLGISFSEIIDNTPGELVNEMSKRKIRFGKQIALDRRNPRGEEETKWRRTCSFYPQEIKKGERREFIELEDKLHREDGSKIVQGDMKSVGIQGKNFDVVSIMTSLYQMNTGDVSNAVTEARRMVRPGGVVVIQDIAKVTQDRTGLDFVEGGFGKTYEYRTIVTGDITGNEFWEVLEWKNGRCTEVRPGKDFDRWCDILDRSEGVS